jgi:hypothetical protein
MLPASTLHPHNAKHRENRQKKKKTAGTLGIKNRTLQIKGRRRMKTKWA